jgi:hypothetical protein
MRSLLTLVCVCGLLGVFASPAQSGTYDVWSCGDPERLVYDGVTNLAWPTGWRPINAFGILPYTSCEFGSPSTAKAIAVATGGATADGAEGAWTLRLPPGVLIDWVHLWRDIGVTTSGVDAGFAVGGLEAVCDRSPCSAGLGHPGVAPGDPFAGQRRVDYQPILSRDTFKAFVRCRLVGGCASSSGSDFVRIYAARFTLSDTLSPVLTASSGSLLGGAQPHAGSHTFSVTAHDEGAGLAAFALEVDGTEVGRWAATADPRCVPPYNNPQPCPAEASGSFGFDTAKLVDGRHSVRVKAIDASGNEAASAPVEIVTENRSAGCRTAGGPAITASLGRAGRKPVRFGRRATLRGRVLDAAGQPVAGAQLQIVQRLLLSGAPLRVTGTVTTDAEGRVEVRLPRGPSRELRLGVPAGAGLGGLVCSPPVRLRVRAGIGFSVRPRRVSPDGRIVFSGRLRGGPGARGVQVAIYAVARRGRARVPVEIVRTGAKGRFAFRYRFQRSFAPFTYRFRARVRRQAAYPYAAAWSRTVVVRIVR